MNWSEILAQISWQPRIGDPTIMGWITVGDYLLVSILCFLVARRAEQGRIWAGLGVVTLLLGGIKATNFLTFFTQFGRAVSRTQQWYDNRQLFQIVLMLTAVLLLLGLILLTLIAFRNATTLLQLAISSLILLVGFVLLRAASLHGFDAFIQAQIAGVRFNWIVELGLLLLLGLPTALALQKRPFGPSTQPVLK
jgi:hypothetical protein